MKIELISTDPPCRRCRDLYETLQNLVKDYTGIELVKDFMHNRLEYINYPTPVIIMGGEVVSIGKAPSKAVLDRLIQAQLAHMQKRAATLLVAPQLSAAGASCACD